MTFIEVRVTGVRQLRRKIAQFNNQLDGQLLDETAMKISNQTAGAIRRNMTMSGVKRKSGTLWSSWQPRQTGKGNWIISPITNEPSGMPTATLATILDQGRLIHGWRFVPSSFGRHGEGTMKKGGYHYTRPRRFIAAGVNEGRARARGIAENDMSKLIRRVFR